EGRDFDLEVLNAQGDMATVSALIDSAVTRGADMLMTLSTPTLQAAIRRAQNTPIVFSYVANGIVAGAGRSETDHLHNVTGVSLIAPYDEMMTLLRRYYPSVRTVGTLFVPSESNMVFHREQMLLAAKKVGIDVVVLPVSTATEVPDAALALTSQKIDAVCQMPGNLTAAAFGSIRQAALRARLPVFAFQKSQAVGGAVVVFGRDYFDSGKEAARMASSVMRGRSPATIPLENFSKTELILNPEAAREIGFPIPPALLRQAKKIIGYERGNP